ncbi:NADH:flavin oxidoreductase [Thermodesulfobacteriota bacterium]
MSILFTPKKLGNVQIKNRFVHSATYEVMALETGHISEMLLKRYEKLANGGIGLIIPGYVYVHPSGRAYPYQSGIHSDDMIPGLKRMVDIVHHKEGKITFQLVHAGLYTRKDLIGQIPLGPSIIDGNAINTGKAREMSEEEIQEVIQAFGNAARRAAATGADGIQLHAAHGYLISQFISPFFNHRKDAWGGSDENRFRFLKEVILETRKALPEGMLLLVKLNADDYTPQTGVTPPLAAKYAGWLAELGIDGLELSCGTVRHSFMNMCRGDVPVNEIVQSLPLSKRSKVEQRLKSMAGQYDLVEGYNLEAAKMIKPVLGKIPLLLVGGLRTVAQMEEVIEKEYADFISMCRPFIREPNIVNRIEEGKADKVACVSCNRCFAAVPNNLPVRCYHKSFPSQIKEGQ